MTSNTKEPLKVAFLFGAGAEGEGNYGLKTGLEFLKSSLCPVDQKKILQAITKNFNSERDSIYFPFKYVIKSDLLLERVLFIKALRDESFFKKYYDNELKIFLNKNDFMILERMYACTGSKKNRTIKHGGGAIASEFHDIVSDSSYEYSKINTEILKDLFERNDKGLCEINTGVTLGPILDSQFHSLINPSKYSKVYYSKVFNYYWFCYFSIIEGLLKTADSSSLSGYYKETELDYEKIIRENTEFTNDLYNAHYHKEHSYYSELRSYLDNNRKRFSLTGCITTNYFDFSKRDLLIEDDNEKLLSNINGKLNLFEYPELNCVADHLEESYEHKVFFPFIFGQSTVKPIVHPKQIEEFEKCSKILKDADILVVLGYGINEDDNHLNAYIIDFLRSKKKVFVANPNIKEDYVRGVLRVDENIKDQLIFVPLEKGSPNKENIEKIFNKIEGS